MLKAGFSRVDVTPPLGSSLEGYFTPRHAKGVLDPLYLNALALSVGENRAVIITADFEMMRMTYMDIARKKISERVGIPENNIMISTLHPHTSIAVRDTKGNNILEDRAYIDMLYRKFCDVAEMAINDMADAELSFGIEETSEKIAFIRRYLMKDGSYVTNPINRMSEVVRPYRDADNNVRLCKFKREGKKDIALVNFSTHPDVIGGEYISADWPGFVRRFVEEDIEGTHCLLINGVEGDSNHYDFTSELKSGYEHSRHMGRVIADTVIRLWDKTEEVKVEKLSSDVEVILNKTRTDGIDDYEWALKVYNDPNKSSYTAAELATSSRVVRLTSAPIFQKIPVTVINLGKIGIVGFGGEPFTQYGDDIRARASDRIIICACCTNGGEGYLPTTEAFLEGGYEASASPFSPNLEEQCLESAVKLLNK
jgi:hypothetical protein